MGVKNSSGKDLFWGGDDERSCVGSEDRASVSDCC